MEVAEQAVQLSCWLTQRVQASLRSKEDSAQAKVDKSLVTIADYGVQAVVSWVLAQAYPGETISLIAEEEAKDLTGEAGVATLQRLVKVVNECLRRAPLVGLRAPPHPLTAVEIITAITRGSSPGGAKGRHWILDPVDGTLGFVRQDQYAVALALLDEGRLELGVLGCPNFPIKASWLRYPHRLHRLTEKLYPSESGWTRGFVLSARRGHGAFMEPLVYKDHQLANSAPADGTPAAAAAAAAKDAAEELLQQQQEAVDRGVLGRLRARVRVSDVKDPSAAVFCEPVEKANSNHGLTGQLADKLGMRSEALRMYSMAKYAAIARGDAEIFMKFAKASYREKVWDHAAGVVIVEEAGGVVTDAGGQPLDFSRGRFLDGLDRGIIASSGQELHAVLLEALANSWAASLL